MKEFKLTSVGFACSDLLATHANAFHNTVSLSDFNHTSALILGARFLHTDLIALGEVGSITMEALNKHLYKFKWKSTVARASRVEY